MPENPLTADIESSIVALGLEPSVYFLHPTPTRTLVVAHADGKPAFVVEPDGTLSAYVPEPIKGSLTVVNPPGFSGFPQHDESAAHYDLGNHAGVISDPSLFFVHFATDKPVVVRHSTGIPEFVFEGETPVPIARP